MMKASAKVKTWSAAAVLAVGVLVGGSLIARASHAAGSDAPILAPALANVVPAAPLASSYAPIIKGVLPEVVSVSSSKLVHRTESMEPFSNDPLFQQFFGGKGQDRGQGPDSSEQAQPEREQGLGSGVIIGTNGYIITNNHVVDGASDVKVYLRDKREFPAKVVGTDAKTDIAVLKIDANKLPAIPMGDSSKMEVGDLVFAVGDPFGVGQTVTMGIVSAKGRAHLGIEDYEDFIQTDAPINPGNSGGALINAKGELVGINTAILSRSGGSQGIGFAIPVNLARHDMDQIVEHGHVIRGWLGATIQDVTPSMAKAFGMDTPGGVLIADVSPNSPAAQAGLKQGDIVMSVNGQPISESSDLRLQVSEAGPGASFPMTVKRGTSTLNVTAKLRELPTEVASTPGTPVENQAERGIQVEELTPSLRDQLKLSKESQGVVVAQIDPAGAAASAGLREGDLIQEVDHHAVTNGSEFNQTMQSASGRSILLRVMRDGTGLYLAVDPS
ncbi:MAG: DegQ family serine endoprotease [Candidatus Acidiferrales bacterium]